MKTLQTNPVYSIQADFAGTGFVLLGLFFQSTTVAADSVEVKLNQLPVEAITKPDSEPGSWLRNYKSVSLAEKSSFRKL